ncbi:uncharacterized protein LOC111102891 [Crassostrea virginica]
MDNQAPIDMEDEVKVEDAAAESRVVYKLRDINQGMVHAWESVFPKSYKNVQVSCGDIFEGAPAADAIVSPANSFGFMLGGIDIVYSRHFGMQMQERLQKVIREQFDGEVLVGQAVIIPAYDDKTSPSLEELRGHNEGVPIKYLISVPTMRVPQCVDDTVNAHLAFRAVILAVRKHNMKNPEDQITSVLCPGLGTAAGKMEHTKCAQQMCLAYATHELRLPEHQFRVCPDILWSMSKDQSQMIEGTRNKDDSRGLVLG